MTARDRLSGPGPGSARRSGNGSAGVAGGAAPVIDPAGYLGLDVETPSEDDRLWFELHPARNHRLRPPIGAERDLCGPAPRGLRSLVAVRQVRPGARLRVEMLWSGPRPLGSEARELFDAAVARHPKLRAIEAVIREQAP